MKLRAITPASVSLQLGPPIPAGCEVDFGDEIPARLQAEIEENIKAGLLAIVADPAGPASVAQAISAEKKKAGR